MIAWLIRLTQRRGRCRWCGCTQNNACVGGCWWVNRAETVCSSCEYVDRLLRTAHGRREIASKFTAEGD